MWEPLLSRTIHTILSILPLPVSEIVSYSTLCWDALALLSSWHKCRSTHQSSKKTMAKAFQPLNDFVSQQRAEVTGHATGKSGVRQADTSAKFVLKPPKSRSSYRDTKGTKSWIQLRSRLAAQYWCTLTKMHLVGSATFSLNLVNTVHLEDLLHQCIQPEAKAGSPPLCQF